jgi:hypothetical protein
MLDLTLFSKTLLSYEASGRLVLHPFPLSMKMLLKGGEMFKLQARQCAKNILGYLPSLIVLVKLFK